MCKYRVQAYDPFGFKKLKDVWDKLYEGKDMTYFQSYDWYEIINSMIPLKGEVLYLVVSNGLQPILIAPLWILRRTFGFINKKGCISLVEAVILITSILFISHLILWH